MGLGSNHFKTSVFLSGATAVGMGFSFFIPIFLSRALTVDQYGTYKLLILIQATLFIMVQFGFDAGLFFFVRSDEKHRALYSTNAVLFELVTSTFICALLCLFSGTLARWLHNPMLPDYLLPFCLLLVASIGSQHFEHYLLIQKRVMASGSVIVLQELGKTLAVVGGFYFFKSLHVVFYLMALVSGLKLVGLLALNFYERPRTGWQKQFELFRAQFRYAVPLGISQSLSLVTKMDRYIVSSRFSVRAFALYSVGCLDIPVVPSFGNNLMDLMAFEMVDAQKQKDLSRVHQLWFSTKMKIFSLYVPVAIFFFIFAEKTMEILFSKTYVESAIYFRWYLVSFALTILDSDVVMRAFAKTRELLNFQIWYVLLGAPAMYFGGTLFGPVGVLIGKIVTDLSIYTSKLMFVYRHCLRTETA